MTRSSESPATYSITTQLSSLIVLANVEQAEQIRMLEVQALRNAAQLDFQIAANQLQRDFLAGVAQGVINLAEPAAADAALDRVASNGRSPLA